MNCRSHWENSRFYQIISSRRYRIFYKFIWSFLDYSFLLLQYYFLIPIYTVPWSHCISILYLDNSFWHQIRMFIIKNPIPTFFIKWKNKLLWFFPFFSITLKIITSWYVWRTTAAFSLNYWSLFCMYERNLHALLCRRCNLCDNFFEEVLRKSYPITEDNWQAILFKTGWAGWIERKGGFPDQA